MHTTLPIRRPTFRRLRAQCRRWAIPSLMFLAALPVYAQTGSDPWDNAVGVLKTAFTGTIAQGLSLVAIVVGGLMFAYGEGQSKKMLAGIVFGVGMAICSRSTAVVGPHTTRLNSAYLSLLLEYRGLLPRASSVR
jgi:type IV secretion system protein TrbC